MQVTQLLVLGHLFCHDTQVPDVDPVAVQGLGKGEVVDGRRGVFEAVVDEPGDLIGEDESCSVDDQQLFSPPRLGLRTRNYVANDELKLTRCNQCIRINAPTRNSKRAPLK